MHELCHECICHGNDRYGYCDEHVCVDHVFRLSVWVVFVFGRGGGARGFVEYSGGFMCVRVCVLATKHRTRRETRRQRYDENERLIEKRRESDIDPSEIQ